MITRPCRSSGLRTVAQEGARKISTYEWEHGTIKLPSTETPKVKAALREAHNTYFDTVLRLSKECYAVVKAAGKKGAPDAIEKWGYTQRSIYSGGGFGRPSWSQGGTVWESKGEEYEVARMIVRDVCCLHTWAGKPIHFRTPTVADVTKHLGPKATNRTTVFMVGYEATITFKGNQVTWDVPENNHARDHAHDHFLGKAFFAALNRVTWTRGSGGIITGNDEYNSDSRDVGGGANYTTAQFGPKVAKPRAHQSRQSFYSYR